MVVRGISKQLVERPSRDSAPVNSPGLVVGVFCRVPVVEEGFRERANRAGAGAQQVVLPLASQAGDAHTAKPEGGPENCNDHSKVTSRYNCYDKKDQKEDSAGSAESFLETTESSE